MTVQELIDFLSMFKRDIPVVLDGYEDGFDHISYKGPIRIKTAEDTAIFYGEFDITNELDTEGHSAVLLSRYEDSPN